MSKLGKISYILAAISVVAFGILRFLLGDWVPFFWIPIGLFGVFVITAFVVDFSLYREFFAMKTTKHGMNMGVQVLLVVAILGAVNYIGLRREKKIDLTSERINSLAKQSEDLVKSLKEDLTVHFFYKKGEENSDRNKAAFRNLIKMYQDVRPSLKLEFVEINERPDLAEEYGVKSGAGVVFLDYQGRRSRIDEINEEAVTNALVKVSSEKVTTAYFLQGHGERSLDGPTDPRTLNGLKNLLEGNRYRVLTLNLLETPKVPDDAEVLAIVGAQGTILPNEVGAIKDFVKRGGNLLISVDPQGARANNPLLKEFGLEMQQNYIVNVFGGMIIAGQTFGMEYAGSHKVTQDIGAGERSIFEHPGALKKLSSVPSGLEITELVKTGQSSVAFKDLKFRGKNEPGPFALAMSVEGKLEGSDKEFRAVVFGDADFGSNQMLMAQSYNLNKDILMNSLAYLVRDESAITIRPRSLKATQLKVTPGNISVFFWVFIVPLPIIVGLSSVFLWFRRRHA